MRIMKLSNPYDVANQNKQSKRLEYEENEVEKKKHSFECYGLHFDFEFLNIERIVFC